MRQRPLGISILAILHLAGGVLLCALQIPLLAAVGELQDPLRAAGVPPILLVLGMLFLAVLGITAGVGMWLGKQWGWWFGAFYYVYGVARNAPALGTVAELADDLPEGARGPGYYYAKHGMRILVHLLILLYFFKGNVLAYFGLEEQSKWKAVSALVAACLAVAGVATAISLLAP